MVGLRARVLSFADSLWSPSNLTHNNSSNPGLASIVHIFLSLFFFLKICLHIWRELTRKRIGMNGHIFNARFSEWPERLFVDRKLFKFIQGFQSINNPAQAGEEDVSYNNMWNISRCTAFIKRKGYLLSKHCVLHIQMGLFGICDEKLGAVCVGAVVSHWDHSSNIMLK